MSLPNLQSSGHATRVPPNALPSLRRYLLANVGLSFALGIQNVVIGWLVAYALAESPSHIGNIFAALMLPSLFLTLFAGLVAEGTVTPEWAFGQKWDEVPPPPLNTALVYVVWV